MRQVAGHRKSLPVPVCLTADLLLGGADVLQVCNEGRLTLMQRSFQLFECAGYLGYRLALSFVQLARDLAHQLDGCCELRQPARWYQTINLK